MTPLNDQEPWTAGKPFCLCMLKMKEAQLDSNGATHIDIRQDPDVTTAHAEL